jgi:curved DNA-binding protein
MSPTETAYVDPGFCPTDTFALEIGPSSKTPEDDTFASDHYEILRLGPQADEDAIERVYRTLADRFHPDNPTTGDPKTYLRVKDAYETLSNPSKRAQYNNSRQRSAGAARFRLRGREFFDGVRGEQNRRLAALCLLYRQRISTHESPGLTLLDLETLTGCTREELGSALWYLCEKKWASFGDTTEYSITAVGFDVVESKLEERFEFRALAMVRYYGAPVELENGARH